MDEESESEDEEREGEDDDLSSVEGDLDDVDLDELSGSEDESDGGVELDKIIEASAPKPERKRKRKGEEEDLEGKYMQKLAREEQKEEEERKAREEAEARKKKTEKPRDTRAGSADTPAAPDMPLPEPAQGRNKKSRKGGPERDFSDGGPNKRGGGVTSAARAS